MSYTRTVNSLQILIFVKVTKALYGVNNVTFSTTPYKIIEILLKSFIW